MPRVLNRFVVLGLGLVMVTAISCGKKEPADQAAGAGQADAPTVSTMLPLPPDSLVYLTGMTAAGREISVEIDLWYNLMPGPDDGAVPSLNVRVRLMTDETATIPGDFVINYVWVAMGGGIWGIGPEEEQIGSGAVRERMFRGGPIYDAEDGARVEQLPTATVTVRVADEDGRQYYMKAADQPVDRVN